MNNDRMMQALGRIERAISRLEIGLEKSRALSRAQTQSVTEAQAHITAQAEVVAEAQAHITAQQQSLEEAEARLIAQAKEIEQLKAAAATPAPAQGDLGLVDPFSHDKALAALKSLDSLIDDLQKARQNG
jgi:hypothetical protein